jgi:gas vesicle protein
MLDYKKVAKRFIKDNSSLFKKDTNNNQAVVALVAGLALGAVFSILFAPKKGNVTRRFISKKSKNAYSTLKEKYLPQTKDAEIDEPVAKKVNGANNQKKAKVEAK